MKKSNTNTKVMEHEPSMQTNATNFNANTIFIETKYLMFITNLTIWSLSK